MKFRELLSVLIIHRSNFEVLHWKVKGRNFDKMHVDVTSGYYDMLSSSIDEVAELGLRLNINPVNYLDAFREVKKVNPNITVLDTSKDYNRDDVVSITDTLLRDILKAIEDLLYTEEIQNERTNVGIKAILESMYNDYDKELRFLNERRKDV